MSTIGILTATKEGGWIGTIHTLTIRAKIRLVPNDNRPSDLAPTFRIFVGRSEIGAAWPRQTAGDNPRPFLRIRLDDPSLPEPLMAALFEDSGGQEARLIWKR